MIRVRFDPKIPYIMSSSFWKNKVYDLFRPLNPLEGT